MRTVKMALIFIFALLLTSCELFKIHNLSDHTYLCSINSNGTGFKKLLDLKNAPWASWDVQDLYVTYDGKLIVAAYAFYLADPDSLNFLRFPVAATSGSCKLQVSNENQVFYTMGGNLSSYNIANNVSENLTPYLGGDIINLNMPNNGNLLTFETWSGDLYYYNIAEANLHTVLEPGNHVDNSLYNPTDHKIYYSTYSEIHSINLDGTCDSLLFNANNDRDNSLSLTNTNDELILIDSNLVLKIINIQTLNETYSQQLSSEYYDQAKVTKNSNKIFYLANQHLYQYNMSTGSVTRVFQEKIMRFCPNWNGDKIYFTYRETDYY
jgi:hypothetical protein